MTGEQPRILWPIAPRDRATGANCAPGPVSGSGTIRTSRTSAARGHALRRRRPRGSRAAGERSPAGDRVPPWRRGRRPGCRRAPAAATIRHAAEPDRENADSVQPRSAVCHRWILLHARVRRAGRSTSSAHETATPRSASRARTARARLAAGRRSARSGDRARRAEVEVRRAEKRSCAPAASSESSRTATARRRTPRRTRRRSTSAHAVGRQPPVRCRIRSIDRTPARPAAAETPTG